MRSNPLGPGQDFEAQPSDIAGRPTTPIPSGSEFRNYVRWSLLTRERLAEPGARPAIAISKGGSGTTRRGALVQRFSASLLAGSQPGALPEHTEESSNWQETAPDQ